jgi:hypothetical protein
MATATLVLPVGMYPRAPFFSASGIHVMASRSDRMITGNDRKVGFSEAIVSLGPNCPDPPLWM